MQVLESALLPINRLAVNGRGCYITRMHNPLVTQYLLFRMNRPYSTRPVTTELRKPSGFCFDCGALATTEALFQEDSVIVLQRYCDKCLPHAMRQS